MEDRLSQDPSQSATLYIRGIDENIKIPALIESIRDIFAEFGNIIDVVAKKNIKAKGQAFIVFSSPQEAQDAMETLQGFDLFDRPMNIQLARTRSDATVAREEGAEALDTHKRKRLAEKERKQALAAAEERAKPAKRAAAEAMAERPAKTNKAGAGAAAADEFLPPNKILLLRDFPDSYEKLHFTSLFQRFPGFKEVRTVPGRQGIAFVEYEAEEGAIAARDSMNGIVMEDKAVRVTYQKQ